MLLCIPGRDLLNMAKKRPNVIPIIEDARHPARYRMLVPMVDVIFADVAQPDQGRIVGLNAQYFLKNEGYFAISIKVNQPTLCDGALTHAHICLRNCMFFATSV